MDAKARRHRAVTIVEAAIVMCVLSVLAGTVMVTSMPRGCSVRDFHREVDGTAVWLSERVTLARLEESTFVFYFSEYGGARSMNIRWRNGSKRGTTETIDFSHSSPMPLSSASYHVFAGTWHTFTPAVTIIFKPQKGCGAEARYILVSGTGYIRAAESI